MKQILLSTDHIYKGSFDREGREDFQGLRAYRGFADCVSIQTRRTTPKRTVHETVNLDKKQVGELITFLQDQYARMT